MKEVSRQESLLENSFPKAARNKGMETRPASRHEQRVEHIDFWMSPRGWRPNLQKREKMTDKPKWSVEVKAMKVSVVLLRSPSLSGCGLSSKM